VIGIWVAVLLSSYSVDPV